MKSWNRVLLRHERSCPPVTGDNIILVWYASDDDVTDAKVTIDYGMP